MERWELERKRSKKLVLFLYVLFHVSKRNQRLTDRCVWPSIAQAIRIKNAWLSKPDECSKYMAFTTHQIWSNITIPFRRRFVGYTNILLFYEKPKATPFQKWKPLSSAFNKNLLILHMSFMLIHFFHLCSRLWMLYVKRVHNSRQHSEQW